MLRYGGADHCVVLKDAKAVLAERFGITHATIQIEVEECVGRRTAVAEQESGQRLARRASVLSCALASVCLEHAPLQFALCLLHLPVVHLCGRKIRLTDRDADAANGDGMTNLSQVFSTQAGRAAYAIGTTGLPEICAAKIAPGLNLKRGPRGPSGVIAGRNPSFTIA